MLRTVEAGAEAEAGSGAKYKTLMNLLMQLRKCHISPYLPISPHTS